MGTNETQAFEILGRGLDLFQGFQVRSGHASAAAKQGEQQADLLETDARADANEAQRRAGKDADACREERQKQRSKKRSDWGGANLEMSGSKAVIRDAETVKDLLEEDDVLFEGQRNADAILRNARNRGNLLRVNSGGAANRSTLSLGSKIYGPRR